MSQPAAAGQRIDFRVLGPLELTVGGVPIALGGKIPRALLAMLLINRNRVVSATALANAAWNDEPPADYRNNLQVAVSKARAALQSAGLDAKAVLPTAPPGYRIVLADTELDAARFSTLKADGERHAKQGQFAEASRSYVGALSQLSGHVLGDLSEFRFAEDFAREIEESVLGVTVEWARAENACGRPQRTIDRLRAYTKSNPYHEPLHCELIKALYMSGRQTDALDTYQLLRRTLGEELGIDPGPAARELERHILTQAPLPPSVTRPVVFSAVGTVIESGATTAQLRDSSGKVTHTRPGALRIGRDPSNHIVLKVPTVSGRHAAVINAGTRFILRDENSTNGTYLRGERLLEPTALRHGDVIRIGGIEFVFEVVPTALHRLPSND
jgi:DNA-binding SARP family transcriptional activator